MGFDPLIKLSNHGYEASTASTLEFGAASATAAKCQVRWISSTEVANQHGFRRWWQLASFHARRHDAGHVQRHESRGHERWSPAAELGRHAVWRRACPWKLYTALRQLPWAPEIEQLWQWEWCLQTRSWRTAGGATSQRRSTESRDRRHRSGAASATGAGRRAAAVWPVRAAGRSRQPAWCPTPSTTASELEAWTAATTSRSRPSAKARRNSGGCHAGCCHAWSGWSAWNDGGDLCH